jgi:hypothetical protein
MLISYAHSLVYRITHNVMKLFKVVVGDSAGRSVPAATLHSRTLQRVACGHVYHRLVRASSAKNVRLRPAATGCELCSFPQSPLLPTFCSPNDRNPLAADIPSSSSTIECEVFN